MRDNHKKDNLSQRRRRISYGIAAAAAAVLAAVTSVVGLAIANDVRVSGRQTAADVEATGSQALFWHRHRPRHPGTAKPTPRPSATRTVPPPPPPPSPTPAPQLSGCAADPHGCGYADATDTGPGTAALVSVPGAQTHGTGWAWDGDHIVVTSNGATVSGLNIDGWVEVDADNVTLNNLNITETGDSWGIGLYCQDQPGGSNGCAGTTIENTMIGSPSATGPSRLQVGIKDVYGDASGTQINKVNIYHSSTGIQISNGTIENSYIHDFGYDSREGDHLNGITVGGGISRPLLIEHNTILNNYDQTDAVALFQDFGPENNKTISDNFLAGGSYALYGGGPNGCTGPATAAKCDPSSKIVVTGNVFSTIFFPTCGTFGPVANFNAHGSGNVWSGNTWADGPVAGRAISP